MNKRFLRKRKIERVLGITAAGFLILAAILGFYRAESSIEPYLNELLSEEERYEQISNTTYEVIACEENSSSAYIEIAESMGYGGPLKLASLIDTSGTVIKQVIIDHKETPSYVEKVKDQKFPRQLSGKNYQNTFRLKDDLDGVSGATYTSSAMANATRQACYKVASEQLNLPVPVVDEPTIRFGLPEVLLILLYALSLFGIYSQIKWKKALRWTIMITGVLSLGFYFTVPLSLSKINSFLIGYWPQWQTNLYWYLLIGGGLVALLVTNKRTYCNWICPFGTTQQCLGLIGGAKRTIKGKAKDYIVWVQRGLAFMAIASALYFRNPGVMNYEVFGTFFSFTGSSILFAVTGLYVLASMVIKRPYCNSLCPITPVEEFIVMMKRWIVPNKMMKEIVPQLMHEKN